MTTSAITTRQESALATTAESRGFLIVDNFKQAIEVAEYINKSQLVPDAYRGKPADIVIAMQYGMELGLSPLQALQSVAVINGKPSIYGDAVPAIVIGLPECEDIIEVEPTGDHVEQWVASCTVKRRGKEPKTRSFSWADAARAGLVTKTGPWTNYPKRMLLLRARGFAIRDAFPDRMKGMILAEEAMDYPPSSPEPSEPRRVGASSTADAKPSAPPAAPAASESVPPAGAAAQPTPAAAPTSPPVSNGEGATDQEARGLKVLKTEWVEDTKGGFGEITTTRGVFCTRDNDLFSQVGSFEGTDHLAAFTWRHAKRTKKNGEQVRIQLVTRIALDEEPQAQQPELLGGEGAANAS